MKLRSVRDISDLHGVRVFVRASLNTPIEDGVVQNDFRLRKMMPTITYLREKGARIILIGHLSGDASQTLLPVAKYFEQHFPVEFIEDILSADGAVTVANMADGAVAMCENIRRYKGERANDKEFAERLATRADIYVNDDFPTCHREHATIIHLPHLLPSCIGLQFEEELKHLSKALQPPSPSLFMLGGIKFETKLPLARQLLNVVDTVFIGGGPANDIFVAKGYEIGHSLTSGKHLDLDDIISHPKLRLPIDVLVRDKDDALITKTPDTLTPSDFIRDAGKKTIALLDEEIQRSAFVLWNGPLGDYTKGFTEATDTLAKCIAASDAYSVVGGGDTVAAVEPLGIADGITFLSTAGGAMIDFLADGMLPGITALEESVAL